MEVQRVSREDDDCEQAPTTNGSASPGEEAVFVGESRSVASSGDLDDAGLQDGSERRGPIAPVLAARGTDAATTSRPDRFAKGARVQEPGASRRRDDARDRPRQRVGEGEIPRIDTLADASSLPDSSETDPEQPTDADLMTRFQAGEVDAYETLVRRHLAFVLRHARRYVSDSASADDVAQDVFLRLYRSADLFREPTNFKGWLATMTSRLALNEIRTRKRKRWVARSTVTADGTADEWTPGNSSETQPPDQVLRDEQVALVREALQKLPARQREALYLQRFEGWDLEQLGEAFAMSIPAVKSLLHRARGTLMKLLEPYMRDDSRNPNPSSLDDGV